MKKGHKQKQKKQRKGVDIVFLTLIIIMLCGGLIMVFSASPPRALFYNWSKYHFIIRQIIFSLCGIVAMLFMSSIDYNYLKKYAPLLCLFVFLLNVSVPFVGIVVNGARRWLGVGPLQFQPSEIGKYAILFYLSYMVSIMEEKRLKTFRRGFLPLFLSLCLFLLCFLAQRHLSATMVTFGAAFLLLAVSGVHFGHILITGLLGAVGMVASVVFVEFRMDRIMAALNPFDYPTDEGYQSIQSLLAIGSGGAFGRGLGQSRQKFLRLPEAHNDYIFAIICEEFGFVGATFVIVLFVLFVCRGLIIALHAKDKFGALVAFGFVSLLGLQMLINVAVVTLTIPPTGMQLPFFSYGGTSLIIIMAAMGVVLNISRHTDL